MADYELIALDEAPEPSDLRAPTASDRGVLVGGLLVQGASELNGGAAVNGDPVATVSRVSPLWPARKVAMIASLSSGGPQILNDAEIELGTGDFGIKVEFKVPDWTPSSPVRIAQKTTGTANLIQLVLNTNGTLTFAATISNVSIINVTSTVPVPAAAFQVGTVAVDIVRQQAGAAGSAVFSFDGVQLGNAITIPAAATVSLNVAAPWVLFGGTGPLTTREANEFFNFRITNRAQTIAENLRMISAGADEIDMGARQTPFTSGLLTVGKRYIISTYNAGDNFTNVGAASNAAGVVFIATGTTPTTWTNASALVQQGIILQVLGDDAQWDTGQVFDTSGNDNHMLLPASGATVIPPRRNNCLVRARVRIVDTTPIDLLNVAQAIVPPNAFFTPGMAVRSQGATVSISIGDGNSFNRYLSNQSVAVGTRGLNFFTRHNDGINLRMVLQATSSPLTPVDMMITFAYDILENF